MYAYKLYYLLLCGAAAAFGASAASRAASFSPAIPPLA